LTVGEFKFNGGHSFTINVNGDLYFDGAGVNSLYSDVATLYIYAGTTTFTGGASANNAKLVVNGGTLAAGANGAWGTETLYINSGALEAVTGTTPTLSNAIEVEGNFFINGSSDLTLSGGIDLGSNIRTIDVNNTGVTTLSGDINDGGIIKAGAGTLVLSGTNSIGLGTEITAGTLVAANDSALGIGPLALAGGTLEAGGSGDRILDNTVILTADSTINGVASNDLTLTGLLGVIDLGSYTLSVTGDGDVTLAGVIGGSGGLILASTGTLTLSGANNPYSGDTNVFAGLLKSAADNAIGKSGTTNINMVAKVDLGGYNQTFATLNGGGDLTGAGVMTVGAGDFSGVISGTGGQVVKNTAGTLTLSGNNTYTGGTTITDGTLVAASDSALGVGLVQLAGGTLQAGGIGDRTLANYVFLSADSFINGTTSNALKFTDGINLHSSYTLNVTGDGDVTLTHQVFGSGGLTLNSTGTLTLSRADNIYTGNTTVNAGTLASGANNAIGQGATSINTGAKVNLGSYNQTFATLNGGGELTGAGVMNIGAGDFSGVISGSGGSVVKDTAGTLTLSGPSTYDGGTTITAGTLVTANAAALGAGAVKVGADENDVATLHLITDLGVGDFTLNQLAILQVAAGKTLTLSGSFYNYSQTENNWPTSNGFNLTMSGSTFEVAGYDYGAEKKGFSDNFNLDTLTVTGNLELVDAVDNGNRGGFHGGQEAIYVNFLTGESGVTLDLNGLWLYVFNDGNYFALADGVYNNITVTGSPVPVPGAVWLLGSGLLGLLGLRRKYLG
jgi:autotransporter-associated beta strand protein